MKRIVPCVSSFVLAVLIGCGGTDSDDDVDNPDGGMDMVVDAPPPQSFPAVCDEQPFSCPDASSLALCESGSITALGPCSFLPITTGCATAGCPSNAQICRTAESAAGHCTHFCVSDADCPIEGGGTATCTTFNGNAKICVVN